MGRYITRLNPTKIFRVAVAMWATALLVACGGSGEPTGPSSQTPASPASIVSPTGPSGQGEAQDTPLVQAVLAYLRSTLSTPYRDVRVTVVREDESFATAGVRLFMRKSESDTWQEYVATIKMKNLNGEWRVSESSEFVLALAPQMTATAEVALQRTAQLEDLDMLSAQEGWAIGRVLPALGRPTAGTVVLRYTEGQWVQAEYLPDVFLLSIHMVGENEGWAVGYTPNVSRAGQEYGRGTGLIMHYEGGKWQEQPLPPADPEKQNTSLTSVYMLSTQEGWATGIYLGERGRSLLHYKGGEWQYEDIVKPPGGDLLPLAVRDVTMVNPDLGWAVGDFNILKYEEGKWTPVLYKVEGYTDRYESPTKAAFILGVSALTPDEGWAVARGAVLHYTGGKWTIEAGSTLNGDEQPIELKGLLDVQMLSADDVWAVGAENPKKTGNLVDEKSVIVHYTQGEWRRVEHPVLDGRLSAIDMVSPQEGWAVGFGGAILHYKDGIWSRYER